jgi:hypothetical protein
MTTRSKGRRSGKPKRGPVPVVAPPIEPLIELPPTVPPPARTLFERWRTAAWWLFSVLVFVFYLWTATSSNKPFALRDTSREFQNLLTDALRQGHTYLDVKPAPQLLALRDPYDPAANEPWRLHDASLYRGRYYLYFGIAPALTLYVPWRAMTGKRLSDDVAVTLFCMGGYVFSCLLLFLLLRATRTQVPWFLQAAAVVALGLGQAAPMVLRRPRVYEVAVSAGYCFLFGGLYFLARRVTRPDSWRWWPALAAACFGLAAGSRPHCAIAGGLVAAVYGVYLARRRGLRGRVWTAEFARFAGPLAAAWLSIGWYNYIRFGNPLEFGVRYQVGLLNFGNGTGRPLGLFLRQVFASLYYFLICLPTFKARFPFLEMRGGAEPFGNPELYPKDYFHEPVAGILVLAPLCAAALTVGVLLWRRRRLFPSGVRTMLVGLLACGCAMFASVVSMPGVSSRYELDFLPSLLVAGVFVCVFLSARLPWRRMRIAAAITVAGCVWGAAANIGASVNSYGYPLERPYGAEFRAMATRLGAGQDALMQDVESLHLDATITFPDGRPDTKETILALGIYERWNLLLVQYVKGGYAMLAYVQCNISDAWAPWVPLLPGRPQRLTVDYRAAEKRIVARLDGKTVLDFPAKFYPTARDQVTVGKMLAGRFGLRDFSGRIEVKELQVTMRK